MFLDTTTKSLEIVLGALVTTNQLPVVIDYIDMSAIDTIGGCSDTITNSTTAVTVLTAPAISTVRKVNGLSVYNADTVTSVVTIRLNNNTTMRNIISCSLAAGDSLIYTDTKGFYVIDASGNIRVSPLSFMTSAELATVLSDETGTGLAVFNNSPSLTTPTVTAATNGGHAIRADQIKSSVTSISASVSTNALTVTLNPCILDFRSSTLTDGATSSVFVPAAINMTISSGSTLGTVSAVQSNIAVLAINNAGTVELAVVNMAGTQRLDERGVVTTVAEGGAGAADSASVVYSTTARTGVAYRVVGYVVSTQATAGTWATSPSLVQGMGGNSLTSLMSLGFNQTWADYMTTPGRALGVTYYNTTGSPIAVTMQGYSTLASSYYITVNGVVAAYQYLATTGTNTAVTAIIPTDGSYSGTIGSGTPTLTAWYELR